MDNPWKDLATDNGEYVARCDKDDLDELMSEGPTPGKWTRRGLAMLLWSV